MVRRSASFLPTLLCLPLVLLLHCQNATQNETTAGKVLIFQGGSTSTALFDSETLTITSAAPLPEALGAGASSFQISAGTHQGKTMTILGQHDATTGKTYLYDAATNGFTPGAALFIGIARAGAHFNNQVSPHLQVFARGDGLVFAYDANNDTWGHAGWLSPSASRPLLVHLSDASQTITAILHGHFDMAFYDHARNFAHNLTFLPPPREAGANLSIISSGALAGNGLLIAGGGLPFTSILTRTAGQLVPAAGPDIQQTPYPNFGSYSIAIETGVHAGKILVVHGASSNVSSVYDPTANVFTTGPSLTANVVEGSHVVNIKNGTHAGKFLVVHGHNSNSSSLYEPGVGHFVAGPALPFNLGVGGHSVQID